MSTLGNISFSNGSAPARNVSAQEAYDVWTGKSTINDVFGIDTTDFSEEQMSQAWNSVHDTYNQGMHAAFLGALASNVEGPEVEQAAVAEFASLKSGPGVDGEALAQAALDGARSQIADGASLDQVHDQTVDKPDGDQGQPSQPDDGRSADGAE